MKAKKALSVTVITLNVIGVICLIYFAVPYLTHDTTVPNPDAMLPAERWDSAGMALTIGLIPMLIVNTLGFLFAGKKGKRSAVNALFFFPE